MSLLMPLGVQAQSQIKEFSEEDELFIKEMRSFLKAADKDKASDFLDDWEKAYWDIKKGTNFNQEQRAFIFKVCNWMLKKRVKPFPTFKAFLSSMGFFSDGKLDDKNFQVWVKCVEKCMGAKTLTSFTNFIEMTENLFRENAIFSSVTTKWKASSNLFRFEFDSVPSLVFEKFNLSCFSIGDSLNIYNTSGVYNAVSQKWYGNEGRVNWKRAFMDENMVYAELGKYYIDFKTTGYHADSVWYYNPKFFKDPLRGKLSDKVLSNMQGEKAIYPTFDSYDKRYSIKNIFKDVDFDGGFYVKGAKFIGSGNAENPATLRFRLKDKIFLKATTQSLILRDEKVSGERVAVTFYWENDSIYHPGLPFKFLVKDREVSMIRDNSGIAQTPFFDTWHKLELDFEQLNWKMDEPRIDLKMIIGSSEAKANFKSWNYFRSVRFEQMQGLADVNPLFRIRKFADQKASRDLKIIELAAFMGTPPSQLRPQLLSFAMLGYLVYDEAADMVHIKEKSIDHCLNALGKKDYDVIEFRSFLMGDKVNASINLLNLDLRINGVNEIFLSDSQNVNIRPTGQTVLVKKNRDFYFAGMINAGRFTFFGKEFSFNYDKFKINLVNTDSLRIKVLSDEIDELTGRKKLVNVKTVIQNLQGELLIDNPNNKSGVVNFAQYPVLISKKDSYAYYDQKSVHGGVYKRDKTFFHLEPFTIDSLDNFTNEALSFAGEFESAGIFPTIHEKLVLQPDKSLGINYTTTADGLPLYGDKAKFISKISMSNQGLKGDGDIQYVTSVLTSNDFILFPDSANGKTKTFVEKPQKTPVQFPVAESENSYMHWVPFQDFMHIYEKETPISMYDKEVDFHGRLTLRPGGLNGKGNVEFRKADLASENIQFANRTFTSDTCDFNIKNLADSAGLSFMSTNLKGKVDFDAKVGEFESNGGGSYIKFPVNQYLCFMDKFKWFMEQSSMELSSGEGSKKSLSSNDDLDLTGAEFISIHPDQDSLRFLSPKAKYDLRSNIIRCQDVRYINTGDARVYPDSGKVVIYRKAKMDDFKNAVIIANTTTKYHTLFNATVTIAGRKKYEGFADYRYKDANENEQLVHFKKVGTDASGQTVGEGNISDSAQFTLSPAFQYKGSLGLQAANPNLFFKGYFRIVHSCNYLNRSWVYFDADINPLDVYIPIDTGRVFDDENKSVGVGLYLASDSIHVYSSYMNLKRQASDLLVADARGFIYYDESTKEYRIASKDKIKQINFQGNYMSLSTDACKIYGEGKLNLVKSQDPVKFETFGSVEHNLVNDTITFETLVFSDFFFDNSLIKQMAEVFEKNSSLEGVPFSRPIYERSLTEMIGKKEADKLISQVNLNGSFKRIPDELEHTLVFSHVKFKWNPATRSFISVGKIGIGNIFKTQLNKYLLGKIEIVQRRSGDSFNMYLADDNNNWYFFSFSGNQMLAVSSDEKWNNVIKEQKPEKRSVEKEKGKVSYMYNLNVASKAKSFLNKFSE
jgi:hypothetical protein